MEHITPDFFATAAPTGTDAGVAWQILDKREREGPDIPGRNEWRRCANALAEALAQQTMASTDAGVAELVTSLRYFSRMAVADTPWTNGALAIMEEAALALAQQATQLQEALKERDAYRTLAGIGVWHKDCRPNREMAACELAKSQAVINKLADTISERESQLLSLRAELETAQRAIAATEEEMELFKAHAFRLAAELETAQQERDAALSERDKWQGDWLDAWTVKERLTNQLAEARRALDEAHNRIDLLTDNRDREDY